MARPKKNKHPRLRNGFGSIRYLGKNRTNPYAVLAPTKAVDSIGRTKYDKPIAYVPDWMSGMSVLLMWHAGTWEEGKDITKMLPDDNISQADINKIVDNILNRFSLKLSNQSKGITFSELYEEYYKYKYEQTKRVFSAASKNSTKVAYKNCSVLHNRTFTELRHNDLQSVVDACTLKHASKELIVSLIKQMYAYADVIELIDKDYSKHLKINTADDDEQGIPFTNDDIKIFWKDMNNEVAEMLIIMIYTGFRINEYKTMNVDLENMILTGGSKTKAGKNRQVPIHSAIIGLVDKRIKRDGHILKISSSIFRIRLKRYLESKGIEYHTPHDCRHTFAKLCDEYNVNENDKKRMLGHAFQDVTNSVYGHRDIESLRKEIEKIKLL